MICDTVKQHFHRTHDLEKRLKWPTKLVYKARKLVPNNKHATLSAQFQKIETDSPTYPQMFWIFSIYVGLLYCLPRDLDYGPKPRGAITVWFSCDQRSGKCAGWTNYIYIYLHFFFWTTDWVKYYSSKVFNSRRLRANAMVGSFQVRWHIKRT